MLLIFNVFAVLETKNYSELLKMTRKKLQNMISTNIFKKISKLYKY